MVKALVLVAASATEFLSSTKLHQAQDFDSLNSGTQKYFETTEKLWKHPWRDTDFNTFQEGLKEWFTTMVSRHCDRLPSNATTRKEKLTKTCMNPSKGYIDVWKQFTEDERTWWSQTFPADEDNHFGAGFKQIMATVKRLSKKELLCLTLFTIDDNCAGSNYIRLAKLE